MKKIIPVDPGDPDPETLASIGEVILKGGVIAFPTDTTYGLAANPFDSDAVSRLFKIKGRDRSKPILLLISSSEMLSPLVEAVLPLAKKVMTRFWPGPLTLVFRGARKLPDALMAGTGKIGIRLPRARLSTRLVDAVGHPITATSANRSGGRPAASAADIEHGLFQDIDHILDGGLACRVMPSTVLDVSTPRPTILREGAISKKTLREALGVQL